MMIVCIWGADIESKLLQKFQNMLYLVKAKSHDHRMCDSSVVQSALSQNDSISKCSHSKAIYCNSGSQLDIVDELEGNKSSSEVHILQQKLQEEMDLHSILENAIKKNAPELSSPSCLPHHAQELLSHITVLEVTISKLEQEMVSLHFQLSQERNERRLAEYHLRHSVSPSVCISLYSQIAAS
ncbi:hypothetical protein CRYUN_Cryun37aG0017800 [Craigia yunnanensis]